MTTEKRQEGDFLRDILAEMKSINKPTSPIPPSSSLSPTLKGAERRRGSLSALLDELSDSGASAPSYFGAEDTSLIRSRSQAEKVVGGIVIGAVGFSLWIDGNQRDPFGSRIQAAYLSSTPKETYIFDVQSIGGLQWLKPLFMNKKVCKVMYDAKTILRFLYVQGIPYDVQNLMDLFLLDSLLHAGEDGLESSLDSLSRRETALILPPLTLPGDREAAASELYLELAGVMWPKIKKAQLTEAAKLEHETVKAIALMENNGVGFDVAKVAKLHDERSEAKDSLAVEIAGLLGKPLLNLDSNPQLLVALREQGFRIRSTDEETLLPYANHPVIGKLLEYRKHKYSTVNFSGPFLKRINSHTGRIHSDFGQLGTATGRMNSTDPNVQNIKNGKNREYIITSPGNVLIIADYKQIDLVVAAVMSGDEAMLSAIRNGVDLHVLTAMDITGKPASEITSEERKKAKAVNFGLLYRISAQGLVSYAKNTFGVAMSLSEADQAIYIYRDKHPDLIVWQDNLIMQANVTFETRTLSQRRRLFKDTRFTLKGLANHEDLKRTLTGLGLSPIENRDEFFFMVPSYREDELAAFLESIPVAFDKAPAMPKPTEVVNAPVQGTGVDILKLAMVLATKRFLSAGDGAMITLSNHDELLAECPENAAERTKEILRNAMEDAGEHYLKVLRPALDVIVGTNWREKERGK